MSENCTQLNLFPEMEESISSPPDSHARTYQLQEIKQELKQIEADYFSRLPAYQTRSLPIAELDPRCVWRTSQISLLETGEVGQEPFTQSWPSEGIIVNGKLYPQVMWAHLTRGKDGGASHIWPTPTTKGYGHASEGQTLGMRRNVEKGILSEEEAQQMMSCTLRPPRMEKWNWPTPMCRDWKDSGKIEKLKKAGQQESLMNRVAQTETKLESGHLNADWVEWLMGYPIGWTSLETSPE